MKRLLNSLFDVRAGEWALTLLMVANYYLILVTYYLLKPARDSLFLTKVSSADLPLVFIVTALVAAPVTALYARASRSLKLNQLINVTLAVLIVNLLGLRYLVQINHSWVYYLFYTWVSIYGALTTSQFWLLANAVYDAAQAKRLFTLLGFAGIVGAWTGGEVTGIVVSVFGVATEDLLFICMGLLVVVGLLVVAIWSIKSRRTGDAGKHSGHDRRESKDSLLKSFRAVYQSRHLRLTVGIIAMTMMVASFVDYQFKTVSLEAFPEKAELTAFLGQFYGRLSLVSLTIQLFFAYRLIRWMGVGGVILMLPLTLLLGSVAMFVIPGLIAGVLLRGGDGALKYSIDKTARELLFLPVPLELKKRTKTFIDMFVDRWFRGLAGALLLLCTAVLSLTVSQLSLVVIGLVALWLVMVIMMRKEYVNSFRTALERRQIDIDEMRTNIDDAAAVNALIISLASENERQVIYALDMLRSAKGVELQYPVRPLLQHQSAEVRRRALVLLQTHDDGSMADQVRTLLTDPSMDVRREAVVFLARLAEDSDKDVVKQLLGDSNPAVRHAGLGYLAAREDGHGLDMISPDVVDAILVDESTEGCLARRQLALALEHWPDPDGRRKLADRLLNDPELSVTGPAMRSVGRLHDRAYIDLLIERLGDRTYAAAAREALTSCGPAVVGTLLDYLRDDQTSRTIRQRLPRVIKEIPIQESVEALTAALESSPWWLKYHLLKALNSLRTRHPELRFGVKRLEADILEETRVLYQVHHILQLLPKRTDTDAARLLRRALTEKLDQNLEHVFRLLGLVYPSRDMYNAYQGITSGKKALRANAIELLDNLLRGDVKRYVLPLVEDVPVYMLLERGRDLLSDAPGSEPEAIRFLMRSSDAWLRCCALYRSAELTLTDFSPEVDAAAGDADPLVRQTAALIAGEKGA